jgi:hypothetical protein
MKLRQELDHDLAFAAEAPELDGGCGRLAAGAGEQ